MNKEDVKEKLRVTIMLKTKSIRKYIRPVASPFKRPYSYTFLDVKKPDAKAEKTVMIIEIVFIAPSGITDIAVSKVKSKNKITVNIMPTKALITDLLKSIIFMEKTPFGINIFKKSCLYDYFNFKL